MLGFHYQARIQMFKKLIANKKKIIVLNKSDLANEKENSRWISYFANKNIPAILFNSTSQDDISKVINKVNEVMEEEKEKGKNRRAEITKLQE